VLLIPRGNLSPQGFGALAAAIAHVNGNDWASDGVHGNPHPLPVRLLPDKALELVSLGFQAWLKGKTYLRKQFAVNKTLAAVKHCFSAFLRTLSFESIKCRWYWPDPQMI
jgi:hypothetical protein